jgi:hypothetical protein
MLKYIFSVHENVNYCFLVMETVLKFRSFYSINNECDGPKGPGNDRQCLPFILRTARFGWKKDVVRRGLFGADL